MSTVIHIAKLRDLVRTDDEAHGRCDSCNYESTALRLTDDGIMCRGCRLMRAGVFVPALLDEIKHLRAGNAALARDSARQLSHLEELEADIVSLRKYRYAVEGIATDAEGNPTEATP